MTASGSSFGPGTYSGRPCRPNVNAHGSFNSPRCPRAAAKSGCGANPRPAANATAPCTRCWASSIGARSPEPGNTMKYARADEASSRLRISSGPMTFFTPRQNVSTRYPAHAHPVAATRARDEHERDAGRAVGAEIDVIPPVAPLDDQLATLPGADPAPDELAPVDRHLWRLAGDLPHERRDHRRADAERTRDHLGRRTVCPHPAHFVKQLSIGHGAKSSVSAGRLVELRPAVGSGGKRR